MEKGKLLKGISKVLLTIASIVCVSVLGYSVEAMAGDPNVVISSTGNAGEISYSYSGEKPEKLIVKIGDEVVCSISDNKIPGPGVSSVITAADILGGLAEITPKTIVPGSAYIDSGNYSVSSVVSGSTYNATGATISSKPIYALSVPTSLPKCVDEISFDYSGNLAKVVGGSRLIAYCYDGAVITVEAEMAENAISPLSWTIDNGDTLSYPNPATFNYAVTSSKKSGILTPSGSTIEIENTSGIDGSGYTSIGKTVKFDTVIDPAIVGNITYSWLLQEMDDEGEYKKVTSSTSKTFSYTIAHDGYYLLKLTAKNGTVTATDEFNFTSESDEPDVKISMSSPIVLNVGETITVSATANKEYFEDGVDLVVKFSGNTKESTSQYYLNEDTTNSNITVKSSKQVTFPLKAKSDSYDGSSLKITLSCDGGKVTKTSAVKIYEKPSKKSEDTTNHTVTFKLPANVASNAQDMTVTGYKVCILDSSNNIKKKSDLVSASASDSLTIKASDYWSLIQSAATDNGADSFTFKIGLQPCGKINNTGDNQEAVLVGGSPLVAVSDSQTIYRLYLSADSGISAVPDNSKYWGYNGESVTVKATGDIGYWEQNGSKISGTDAATSYTHKFSSSTASNKINVVSKTKAAANGTATGGGTGSTADGTGKDSVPKTAESNAPIFLIIILIFAGMGGGYALYLQLRPVPAETDKKNKY